MKLSYISELKLLFSKETQAFRKVHRMIDLFESIIKTYTVVILSEYIKQNKLSDSAKGLLSQGLRTPSLGTWQLFSRVLFEELEKDNYTWLIGEFPKEFLYLDKALNNEKTNVIALRNGYAHGATPTDTQCETDIKKFESFLNQLVDSEWLSISSLEVRDNKVYLVTNEGELSLHPILVYRKEESCVSFAFFNDIKNDKIGLLNYPLSKHYREKDFYDEFQEFLPLKEWKKGGNNEFFQRIEELTETFKGRTAEREQILCFVQDKNKGYLSIQGNPGIGKSALIAQFFKDVKASETLKTEYVVEYFIRRGTQQAQVDYLLNYLIKRTDELFPQGRDIRAEGKMTYDLQYQLFSKWRLWAEYSNGNKLLFLIDGLDEGVENNVLTYLPRENFENILIIYGSRPGGHQSIDELWSTLPAEYHTKIELSGLSKQDIRALIYEVANKYELEKESTWIDAVEKRSQGNPLYLKLLCDALENGSIALNDIKALPKEIDDYYKAILQRYAQDTLDGDALLAGLYTFAAAKDYLTFSHVALINKLGEAQVERVGSTLKEVLYENPLTEEVLDYQLFHESFREYLLREKPLKITEANERILDFCAIWQDLEGSWEQRYCLEHYSTHLNESKKESRHSELLALFQNEAYTNTQKKVLKQFGATKKMFQLSLLKAGEIKENDAQLEAALCLVDLKYEEANDAPQIIALVANNEIDLALQRIESFGGNDEEGLKRKFILYMLCLMDLTLLESKEKPFCKTAIEKILKHFDEQMPVDHSILNWNNFFSSYLIFQMACEWAEIGLNYLIVLKRTNIWEKDWLAEKGPYGSFQFEVLLDNARGISFDKEKSSVLSAISTELAKQGQVEQADSTMQEALTCARVISLDREKSSALTAISTELAKQGQVEEALVCVSGISFDKEKSSVLSAISTELANQGQLEEASFAMQEAFSCAHGISIDMDKSYALKTISTELAKQGQVEEALNCTLEISLDRVKSYALAEISTELAKQGRIEKAASAMQESLACANGISVDRDKSYALKTIITELAKQGKVEEALTCARGMSNEEEKSYSLAKISTELANQGQLEEASFAMQEAFSCTHGISDYFEKIFKLIAISTELTKQGKVEEALACARGITSDYFKISALNAISTELARQDQVEDAASAMQETLDCSRGISDDMDKSSVLKAIITELAKQCKLEEALTCSRGISLDRTKSYSLSKISTELAKHGQVEVAASVIQEAIACTHRISDYRQNSYALKAISTELAKQGQVEEALACTRGIRSKYFKISPLAEISTELAKQGQVEESTSAMQEALACARRIINDYLKSSALSAISTELAKQGQVEEAASAMQEALACARGISNESDKSSALSAISTELAKQGQVEEALVCAHGLSDRRYGSALKYISTELAKQGKVEEALTCARGISDEYNKSSALKDISTELGIQGNWALAESIGLEIPQLAERHSCWKTMAENSCKDDGWQKALEQVNKFKTDEARLFYLKGWAARVNQQDADDACVQEALSHLAHDSESIENLLQKYALHALFFGIGNIELVHRLNKILNIQWAIDIKKQFPSSEEIQRLSTNVEEWLNEIADEDDREEILLWAKKVNKGKMTEGEFGVKLRGILN